MSEDSKPDSPREQPKEISFKIREVKELQATPHEDLVAKYRVFLDATGVKPAVVYHPCCAVDSSPSVAFPDSRVIYAEIDERAVKALQEAGLEAHHFSALEFNPGKVDTLILLNPTIPPDFPSKFVVPGGYVVSKDYHGTATSLRGNQEYELQGIIRPTKDGGFIMDRENLGDYWREVETEEEWRNAPFSWGTVANYDSAAPVVELMTGRRENIMEEYRRIVEMKRQYGIPVDDNTSVYEYKGRWLVLSSKLPSKKGTVDDLFVFQKRQKEQATDTSSPKNE